MMNRFLINLRSLDSSPDLESSPEDQSLSRFGLAFRVSDSILGNIGEPLVYEDYSLDDADWEVASTESYSEQNIPVAENPRTRERHSRSGPPPEPSCSSSAHDRFEPL